MARSIYIKLALFQLCASILFVATEAGVIKNIFHKITNAKANDDRPEGGDKSSSLICGGSVFKSVDEKSLSPEIIFITNRPGRISSPNNDYHNSNYNDNSRERRDGGVNEVAREFSFHEENVTLAELERYGFNRDAPISFVMHGFTSGYPLQAWMSAIVEAYTIDRESQGHSNHHGASSDNHGGSSSDHREDDHHSSGSSNYNNYGNQHQGNNQYGNDGHSYGGNGGGNYHYGDNHNSGRDNYHGGGNGGGRDNGFGQNQWRNSSISSHNHYRRDTTNYGRDQRGRQPQYGQAKRVNHNLFIVNWNYAARGILYPRAVANIPLVASHIARFINEKLLDEARVDPTHIQLIGHSLGAHLAGFTGKNTKEKVGRIYGLDPAGPCFGTITGSLFPASKRLDPSDAEEVITIHTNYALLGIEKAIGRYSVYVEGGKNQPGCKTGGILKTVTTLTVDQANADSIACSHSRAPNLLTYRHDQDDHDDDCQLVAYECKDWESYQKGHCGVCVDSIVGSDNEYSRSQQRGQSNQRRDGPLRHVECLRVGLDWQYPKKNGPANGRPVQSGGFQQPSSNSGNSGYDNESYENNGRSTRRPSGSSNDREDNYGNAGRDEYDRRTSTRRPYSSSSSSAQSNSGNSGYGNESYENNGRSTRRPSGSSYDREDNYGNAGRDEYDRRTSTRRPYSSSSSSTQSNYGQSGYGGYSPQEGNNYDQSGYNGRSSRRPYSSSSSQYDQYGQSGYSSQEGSSYDQSGYGRSTRRPGYSQGGFERQRRASGSNSSSTEVVTTERRGNDQSTRPVIMFLKTGDTQPFCTFQYQVVLELNEPFKKNQPPMSLVLQDSDSDREHHQQSSPGGGRQNSGGQKRKDQNSIIDDEFGRKYDDRTYTQLVTSNQKLKKIDHATLLFRDGLPDGHRILKALHVNYMSHINPNVRRKLSVTLCPVRTDQDRGRERGKETADTRFYFKPCQ